MASSRPIPINKSPRDPSSGRSSIGGRISKSLPAPPASPYLGSLKAPAEFLTGMPPLELPGSYRSPDPLAKSAPALDLMLHRYHVEEKKQNNIGDSTLSSSVGGTVKGKTFSQSLGTAFEALSIRETIEEVDEDNILSPHSATSERKGVLLEGLINSNKLTHESPVDDDNNNHEDQDDELQFELS